MSIIYKSKLDKLHIDMLNEILFFNREQKKYQKSIVNSIEQYGIPKIIEAKNKIFIELDSKIETHSLFMLNSIESFEILLGVAIFIRDKSDEAVLLHIAVNEENETSRLQSLSLILKVKEYLSNISEINRLKIFYSNKTSYLKIH